MCMKNLNSNVCSRSWPELMACGCSSVLPVAPATLALVGSADEPSLEDAGGSSAGSPLGPATDTASNLEVAPQLDTPLVPEDHDEDTSPTVPPG